MLIKWYKSKTIIFNTIAAIVLIGTELSGMNLPPKTLEVIGTVVAVGNVILRFNTARQILTPKRRKKADSQPIK